MKHKITEDDMWTAIKNKRIELATERINREIKSLIWHPWFGNKFEVIHEIWDENQSDQFDFLEDAVKTYNEI